MFKYSVAVDSFRAVSEDRALVFEHHAGLCVVVADGVGGQSGGAIAADCFVRSIGERLELSTINFHDDSELREWMFRVDHDICKQKNGGECTGVIALFTENTVIGVSCGDCEMWVIDADSERELTASQNRKPRLGTGRAIPVVFRSSNAQLAILGTDGLFAYMKSSEIAECVRVTRDATQVLYLLKAEHQVLPDDVSIVVVDGLVDRV